MRSDSGKIKMRKFFGSSGLAASDVEYRFRPWVMAAMFFAGFEFYWWDHVPVAAAVAKLARGGNAHAVETLILTSGAVATIVAAQLRTWAAAYMQSDVVHDPQVHDSRLVADGPYRYVRNPLYLGTILMAFGIATAASRSGFVVLVVMIVLFTYRLILREERALAASQGEGYRRYLAQVPRLLPSLQPRVRAGAMQPQWGQAIRGELFMWAFALTFVLFVVTGSVRLLMWGCIGATVLVLFMRRLVLRNVKRQAAL
jgi:protein-S-isoprenylcysteine O-methyltransferase Ste14